MLPPPALQLRFHGPPDGFGSQPGIVHIERIYPRGHGCAHGVEVHLICVGGEVSDNEFSLPLQCRYLGGVATGVDPRDRIMIGAGVQRWDIFPFATKYHPLQHAFAFEYFQNKGRNALGLDIEV